MKRRYLRIAIAGVIFLLALLTGALRELLGKGTLAGSSIVLPGSISVMLLPCGGFILIGLLAAAAQKCRIARDKHFHSGQKEE